MIEHPLLQPKQETTRQRVMNLAQDLGTREHVERNIDREEPIRARNRTWVIAMVVYLLIAVPAFILVPVIAYNFGDASTAFIENLNKMVVYGSPTLLVVAVLVGITGYYGYGRFAWWLSFGFWISIGVLLLNIGTRVSWLNFGIFWIIIGTLGGMFLGCAFEFLHEIHSRDKFLKGLLIVGMAISIGAGIIAIKNSVKTTSPIRTITDAQRMVSFSILVPSIIPPQYSGYTPKIAVVDQQFLMYYGDDPYPPPPVIDFLSGLEIIETKGADVINTETGSNVVTVQVNDNEAHYREDRGRSVIEWEQEGTYIIMTSHSTINGKQLVDAARSFSGYVEKK
jgi:hypothetical protein